MDLREEKSLPSVSKVETHWYYASKYAFLKKLIGEVQHKVLLDVGAGAGLFSKALLSEGIVEKAVCVDSAYEATRLGASSDENIVYTRSVKYVEADLTILMDVIEHIEDEKAFLVRYKKRIPARSKVIVSVPAFDCLWSDHDRVLGHHRRYTIKSLEATLTEAGFRVHHICYFFGAIFPIVYIARQWKKLATKVFRSRKEENDLKPYNKGVNSVLEKLCLYEINLAKWNKYFGVTVFAVCGVSN